MGVGGPDGIAVLKKAKDANPYTMVIIVTGSYDPESIIDALRLNADDYILKPFAMTDLQDHVLGCLDRLDLKQGSMSQVPCISTSNEDVLNMLKIISHEIRASLVSAAATLKLMKRGYYGAMDNFVGKKLDVVHGNICKLNRAAPALYSNSQSTFHAAICLQGCK